MTDGARAAHDATDGAQAADDAADDEQATGTDDPWSDADDRAPDDHAPGTDDAVAGPRRPDDAVAAWVARVLDAYPRPEHPLTEEWDASVQGLVRRVPFVPRVATRPLGLLDRFGAVTVGPRRVGLDGTDVDWDDVVEIRTEPAWTHLSAEALELDLAQYVRFLPPLPGRAWVVRKVVELVLSLYLAVLPPGDDAARDDADRDDSGQDDSGRDDDAPVRTRDLRERAVTEIVRRRRFGSGETRAGATAVLLQLALPGATDAILRTAAERGVPVVHVAVDETQVGAAVARAAQWRATALALRGRAARHEGLLRRVLPSRPPTAATPPAGATRASG